MPDLIILDANATREDYEIATKVTPNWSWTWTPQPDITAYELALCLPVLVSGLRGPAVESLPAEARRHFEGDGDG